MLAIMNNEIIGIFLSNQYHIRNGSICLNNHFRIALEIDLFYWIWRNQYGKSNNQYFALYYSYKSQTEY